MAEFEIASVATALFALLVVMDPFSSVPVYLSLTRKYAPQKKEEAAQGGSLVAAGGVFALLFGGMVIVSLLGIRIESFQIGGGIIMLIISVSFALGIDYGKKEKTPIEAVIIGVPLLSGPGTMLTSVLLSQTLGVWNVAVAGALVCAVSYLTLRLSSHLYRLMGNNGLEILSRVMGVLLAAFAVEFIRRGMGL